MSFLCLFAFCFAGEPAQPDSPQQLPFANSPSSVEVTADTSPTNARGLQIVSVRLKMQPSQQIYAYAQPIEELVPSYLKLEVSTRDPKTKIDVLYPKGREFKDGGGHPGSSTKMRSPFRPSFSARQVIGVPLRGDLSFAPLPISE
jgi:hypothetical protein